MDLEDYLLLLHPGIAVAVVFPIFGLISNLAWQTRQRRLLAAAGQKSKIPAMVGSEHFRLGKWFSGSVVGLTLLALGNVIFSGAVFKGKFGEDPSRYIFLSLMFAATIASLILLYRAKPPLWRGIFATLTGMGVILLGCQPEVFRRTNEWYLSHYYYGIVLTLLMIFSAAIVPDIYKHRRWRQAHAILNAIAVILFMMQGFIGARDLLEIPLSWQKPYVYKCDYARKVCPG